MGYEVSSRSSEASLIEMITKEKAEKLTQEHYTGIITEEALKKSVRKKGNELQVNLVDNPNSGKISLFML